MDEASTQQAECALDWRDFLVGKPPGTRAVVRGAARLSRYSAQILEIQLPELQLYCSARCNSSQYSKGGQRAAGRLFGGIEQAELPPSELTAGIAPEKNMPYDAILSYRCESCGVCIKTYSIRFWSVTSPSEAQVPAEVEKIAEWPAFAFDTPSKLISLIGPEREYFLKGRRAESAGLGIGAFTYYRRVVESQKQRLIDGIIRVARNLNASEETLKTLTEARNEDQFSNAVRSIKNVIPKVLFIEGQEPLTLLYRALSQGLHAETDEECLFAAHSIRVILVELAEKMSKAMKNRQELKEAVSKLANKNS